MKGNKMSEQKQPEALRLAGLLDDTREYHKKYWNHATSKQFEQSSDELRRLYEENVELLGALHSIKNYVKDIEGARIVAKDTIAKATK